MDCSVTDGVVEVVLGSLVVVEVVCAKVGHVLTVVSEEVLGTKVKEELEGNVVVVIAVYRC